MGKYSEGIYIIFSVGIANYNDGFEDGFARYPSASALASLYRVPTKIVR